MTHVFSFLPDQTQTRIRPSIFPGYFSCLSGGFSGCLSWHMPSGYPTGPYRPLPARFLRILHDAKRGLVPKHTGQPYLRPDSGWHRPLSSKRFYHIHPAGFFQWLSSPHILSIGPYRPGKPEVFFPFRNRTAVFRPDWLSVWHH